MPGQRGQLSLEYLLLLLAALTAFSLLLPLLNHTYQLALFGLDCANARHFAQRLEETATEMRFLGEGSAKRIEAQPSLAWDISAQGSSLSIVVKSPALGAEKALSAQLPNKVEVEQRSLQGSAALLVKKEGGKVLLEHN